MHELEQALAPIVEFTQAINDRKNLPEGGVIDIGLPLWEVLEVLTFWHVFGKLRAFALGFCRNLIKTLFPTFTGLRIRVGPSRR